jgi:hypothetical protein
MQLAWMIQRHKRHPELFEPEKSKVCKCLGGALSDRTLAFIRTLRRTGSEHPFAKAVDDLAAT